MENLKPFANLEPFTQATKGAFATVEQIKGDQRFVIKSIPIVQGGKDAFGQFIDPVQVLRDPIDLMRKPEFGLNEFIPGMEFVPAGQNYERYQCYMVMQRVHGTHIHALEEFEEPLAKQLDMLLANSMKIAIATSNGDFYTMPDVLTPYQGTIYFRNVVVGNVHDDPEIKPYIIDFYPAVWRHKSQSRTRFTQGIGNTPEALQEMIDNLEKKSQGHPFSLSREQVVPFSSAIEYISGY